MGNFNLLVNSVNTELVLLPLSSGYKNEKMRHYTSFLLLFPAMAPHIDKSCNYKIDRFVH